MTLKYLFTTSLLLTALQLLVFRVKTIPQLWRELDRVREQVVSEFPNNLTISWDGQNLSANQSDIMVSWPQGWTVSDRLPTQAALLFPGPNQVPKEELAHQVLCIMYTDQLHLHNTAGEWLEMPLNQLPGFETPFELNSSTVSEISVTWSARIRDSLPSWWAWLIPFFWIKLIAELLGLSIMYGMLIWLFIKLGRGKLSWLRCWQLAGHLAILGIGITTGANALASQPQDYIQPVSVWLLFIAMYYSNRQVFDSGA